MGPRREGVGCDVGEIQDRAQVVSAIWRRLEGWGLRRSAQYTAQQLLSTLTPGSVRRRRCGWTLVVAEAKRTIAG